jgi:hypothetical protein
MFLSGQPKRHLLTTGWSLFVGAKRLKAGDSVLFIRSAFKLSNIYKSILCLKHRHKVLLKKTKSLTFYITQVISYQGVTVDYHIKSFVDLILCCCNEVNTMCSMLLAALAIS